MASLSAISEELAEIDGQIADIFRALSNGFQKLEKIKDSNRQSRQLEELTGKMRECKRLIKEFDREVKDLEHRNDPSTNKMLNEKKQSMVKELNSYVAMKKQYASDLDNKRVDLFEGPSEGLAEDNVLLASCQIYQIYYRIRRANGGTLNQYTHSITGDNYSTPTNLMDGNNSDDNENTKMWTPRIETKLINMLRDEVRNNQTTGRTTSWTIRHWNHYANQLHNIYGFRYTGVKVRQKYQRLKADYQTFKRLQAQIGLGWDPIIGTVVAPDEFWDKASRNVKKFRTKGFEYFQEMAEIVENCCATGALSRASTQGPLDSEEEDDMLNKFWNADAGGSNAGGSNAAEAIPVDLFGDEYIDPSKGKSHKRGPATSQTDSGRSKKSRSSGFDDVCAAFTSYVQAKTGHSRARENENEAVSAGGDDYSLDACQDALLELGDIPPLQYVRALTLFKDKEWRRFFMRTPTHLRLAMILALQ